eukprot:1455955-Pyramimonas_sp.AAC.1
MATSSARCTRSQIFLMGTRRSACSGPASTSTGAPASGHSTSTRAWTTGCPRCCPMRSTGRWRQSA